jgi:hypothetical protein
MFTPNSSRQTLDAYFKSAMMYDLPRLQAVMQGKDTSIPQAVAMMAMQVKKPLVDAAKAQQAGQQPKPPSVKEGMEAEAQMMPEGAGRPQQAQLPERAGIGALPAQNMQGMGLANGGIIAFAEGGDTDLFERPTEEEIAYADANQFNVMNPESRGRGSAPIGGVPDKLKKFQENKDKPKDVARNRAGQVVGSDKNPNKPNSAAPAPVETLTPQADVNKFVQANSDMQKALQEKAARSSTPTAKKTKTTETTPTTTPAEPSAPVNPDADYDRLTGKIGLGAYQKAIKDNEAAGIAGIKTLRDAQKEGKPTGKAYEGLEKSLKKEEGELADKENQNVKMALVEAGFAMAAGESPYALTNIARGGQAGTKAFKEGKEKLQKAADRRQELSAKIEEARRAEERDDYKTKNALEKDIFALERGIKSDTVAGLKGVADISTRVATDLYNQGQETLRANERNKVQERISDKDNASRERQAKLAYGSRGDPAAMMDYRQIKEINDTIKDRLAAANPNGIKPLAPDVVARITREVYAQFGRTPPEVAGTAPVAPGNRPKFNDFFS